MTSAGVTREAAGMPARAPEKKKMDKFEKTKVGTGI